MKRSDALPSASRSLRAEVGVDRIKGRNFLGFRLTTPVTIWRTGQIPPVWAYNPLLQYGCNLRRRSRAYSICLISGNACRVLLTRPRRRPRKYTTKTFARISRRTPRSSKTSASRRIRTDAGCDCFAIASALIGRTRTGFKPRTRIRCIRTIFRRQARA